MAQHLAADSDARIVCDMTHRAGHRRRADGRVRPALRRAPRRQERTAEGIRFRFRADDGVEAWVQSLAAREHACCPFFGSDVTSRR
jgi:hypothetical protein